jgi:hypothetical protein
MRLVDQMQHVANHATMHRGQVVGMIRQLGNRSTLNGSTFLPASRKYRRNKNHYPQITQRGQGPQPSGCSGSSGAQMFIDYGQAWFGAPAERDVSGHGIRDRFTFRSAGAEELFF